MPAETETTKEPRRGVSIQCQRCEKKITLPLSKAYRGSILACPHCGEKNQLVGSLLAEIFWAANHR